MRQGYRCEDSGYHCIIIVALRISRFWREAIVWMAGMTVVTTLAAIIVDGGFRPIVLAGIPIGMIGGFALYLRWGNPFRRRVK